jgi:hypothetical protein
MLPMQGQYYKTKTKHIRGFGNTGKEIVVGRKKMLYLFSVTAWFCVGNIKGEVNPI